MKILIRKAQTEDFADILRLNQGLFDFESQFNHGYNLKWTYSAAGRAYFTERLANENALFFIAEVDEKTIGYILAHVTFHSYRNSNPSCEIENMFIEAPYRRKKIGSMLIETVKKYAQERGVRRLRVGAIAQNDRALQFYRSHGFSDVIIYLEKNGEI